MRCSRSTGRIEPSLRTVVKTACWRLVYTLAPWCTAILNIPLYAMVLHPSGETRYVSVRTQFVVSNRHHPNATLGISRRGRGPCGCPPCLVESWPFPPTGGHKGPCPTSQPLPP